MADNNDKSYLRPTVSSLAKQRPRAATDTRIPWIPSGPSPQSFNVHAQRSQAAREAQLAPPIADLPAPVPAVSEAQRNAAATKIQTAFRGFKARKDADALRVQRQQEIQGVLTDDTNRTRGQFDIQRTFRGAATRADLADSTLFRRQDNPARSFTSYIQYDQHGGPIKRVDLTGAAHAGVPTPHVLEFQRIDRGVQGGQQLYQYSTPENNLARPAYPWELPHDRSSQQASSALATPSVDVRKRSNSATYQQGFQGTPQKVRDAWQKK